MPQPSRPAPTLHLIDIENLAGGSGETSAEVLEGLEGYLALLTCNAMPVIGVAGDQPESG